MHKATRQTHQPRLHDLKLAKKIARYLKGTCEYNLRMEMMKLSDGVFYLESYSDADFAADKSARKSLTGGIIRVNELPVGLKEKKGWSRTFHDGGRSLSPRQSKRVSFSAPERCFAK